MRISRSTTLLYCLSLFCAAAFAQTSVVDANKDSADIKQVLADQQAAWNRGDIGAFMHGYKDSEDTTFISKTIQHGYKTILERYKKNYPTREAMGTLDFSDLTVTALCKDFAAITGKYHLTRPASAGGEATGIFSLIFQREPDGWKIILDHSSSS
jgi:ketosteroid isomerase-like protein